PSLMATARLPSQMHLPAWVVDVFRDSPQRAGDSLDGAAVHVRESDALCLVTVICPGASRLSANAFEQRTAEIYLAIEKEFRRTPARHPVRLWNHLPEIHAPSGDGTDRYMSFNAGRFRSYNQWLGGANAFARTVPSASAAG